MTHATMLIARRSPQRQPRVDAEAAAVRQRARLERAAEHRGALAHPGDAASAAPSGAARGRAVAPSSTTSSSSASPAVADRDRRRGVAPAWRSVFVSASWTIRYADRSTPAGERDGRADVAVHLDGEAGGAQRRDELVEPVQAGLRGRRRVAVAGRDARQQPPQLAERLAPGRLDRAQRRARLVGALVEDVVGRGGLHDDDRDAVRDDVVQLARDPRLLLADRAARAPPRSPRRGCAPPRRAPTRRPRPPIAEADVARRQGLEADQRGEAERDGERRQRRAAAGSWPSARRARRAPRRETACRARRAWIGSPPATAIAMTRRGCDQRHSSATPCATAATASTQRQPRVGLVRAVEHDGHEKQAREQRERDVGDAVAPAARLCDHERQCRGPARPEASVAPVRRVASTP